MTKMKIHAAMLISAMCLFPSVTFGNGAVFQEGLHGVGVIPVQEDGIRLLEEEVIIDLRNNSVRCRFVLENLRDEPRQFRMGFPFNGKYDSYGETPIPDDFFKVFSDKEEIKTKLEKSERYSHVYIWNMSLSRREKKTVYCEYSLLWFNSSSDAVRDHTSKSFRYITHTGGLWADKIAKATFRIIFGNSADFPNRERMDKSYDNNFTQVVSAKLLPSGFAWHKSNGIAEYIFYDWKPDGPNDDISYSFSVRFPDFYDFFDFKSYKGSTSYYTEADLALPEDIWEVEQAKGENCVDGCDETTDDQKAKELYKLKSKYLKYIRNEIFARHGYVFKDKELETFFSGLRWYRSNTKFTTESLNKIEKENIQIILETEKNIKKD